VLTTVPGMIADRMANPARPFAHSRGEPTFLSCTFWQSEKLNKNAACIRRRETEDAYQLAVRQPSVSILPRKRNLPGKCCVGANQASAPGVGALPAEAWGLKAETSRINVRKQREFLRNTKTPPLCRYFANTMRH
jgi:hypothetical protein